MVSSEKHLKESIKESLKAMLAEKGVLKPLPPSSQEGFSKPPPIDVALQLRLKELSL